MTRAYAEWDERGAGFVLNFDPDLGYDSPPRAFGASFTEHAMGRARDILEYGFTGRQLNVAHELAEARGSDWDERRHRVCDFFVRQLVTPEGFCYSHYDIGERRPVYSVGDPSGPVLHYLVDAARSGSYLRLTSEAASDLLLNARSATRRGADVGGWWDALCRIAGFLLRTQRADGAWLRAYTPEGEGISGGPWLGDGALATTATATPVPFLVQLAADRPELATELIAAAERAGDYVIRHQITPARYRGGTLDNPNVVDKESAFIAMAAMVALHRCTGRTEYLDAALSAAWMGMSWTVLWDVPAVPGTRVHAAGVRSTGWGGINSIWGTGVTDVYSLFYLDDLTYLAEQVRDPLIAQVVELTAKGTAQLLAYPGDRFGMADDGMQPEGIAHCGQGVDEGLIRKGDTWGGLGWIYTAGTFGLRPALKLDDERPASLTARHR